MVAAAQMLFWISLKLLLLAFGILYASLVLITFKEAGPGYRFRFDRRNLDKAALYFLIWVGVKILAGIVRVVKPTFEMLTEASAEVGEWYIRRRGRDVQSFVQTHLQ